ncbi:MAG: Ig-like domain-containing protein [Bryobacterales bacterium]|nr:Ig-like domain-containing protein [Bryobacterales bacterium]MCZ2288580.1 Ig-like domain-containing protein [Anaerolineales bacterium]
MTYVLLDGVDKLYYAKVTQDDAAAYAAETPVALAPMKTAVQTPKTSSKVDFYDNQPMFSMQAEGETEIKLDVTQLPLNVQADLLGKAYDSANDSLYDNGGTPPDVALGFRALNSDGTYTYYWFLKGKFQAYEESAATKTDSPDPKGSSLVYTAVRTVHQWALSGSVTDSVKRRKSTKQADGATWFDAVRVPVYSAPSALNVTPSPADGATGQSTSVAIALTFNNALAGGAENGIGLLRDDTQAAIAVTRSINAARKVVTLTHPTLTAAKTYLITVNGVKDVFGQTLADTVFDFATA